MTDIWSKAPEGAIGFAAKSGGCAAIWYKKDEFGNLLYSQDGKPDIWHLSHLVPNHVVWRDSPCAEWKGEGLPPVGTVCECSWDSSRCSYNQIKVVGHEDGRAVFRWLTGPRSGQYQAAAAGGLGLGGNVPRFRPIRTPEQLAAERRAETIKRAANLCAFPKADHTFVILEALYDNGLLKGSDDQ